MSDRVEQSRSGPLGDLRLTLLAPPKGGVFPLQHPYIEIVYLPLLGPTSVSAARHIDRLVRGAGGPMTVDAAVLAAELGLRSAGQDPIGTRAPLRRCLDRLAHAHIARWLGATDLGVLQKLPPVSARTLRRLPVSAQVAHKQLLAEINSSWEGDPPSPNERSGDTVE